MRVSEAAAMLARTMRMAYERGLVNLLGGNASVRLRNGFLITPSQIPKNSLKPSDMVYVDWDEGPRGRASMEWRMHRAIYLSSPKHRAVLHTHNPYTLALYEAGLSVDPAEYVEAHSIGSCVAVVPRLPPGSVRLAEEAAKTLAECRVAVLRGHGIVAAANSLYEALDIAEALEDIARIKLFSTIVGGRVEP